MSDEALEKQPKTSDSAGIWWGAAFIVVVGLVAYANSFGGKFVFDDLPQIVENGAIKRFPAGSLWTHGSRGLVYETLALNYAVGGLNEIGYHAVNLAIHLIAGLALYGIVRRTLLLPQIPADWQAQATIIASLCAALWVAHPLQTQAVTYIIQRLESMMAMFYLLMLYATIRGATSKSWSAWGWYATAAGCFFLSARCKEVAITAPVVVLLYDQLFLSCSWKALAQKRWGFYGVLLLGVAGMLFQSSNSLIPSESDEMAMVASKNPGPSAGFGVSGLSPWEYLRSQPAVILHYLRLAIWPDELCLDYAWPVEEDPLRIYGLGLVIIALLLASIWLYWRRNFIGFLGLSFFLILAPTSSFLPIVDLAFEHRMYLPLAALVVLVVIGVWTAASRLIDTRQATLVAYGLLGVMLIALSARTILRNFDYADPLRMWQNVVASAPQNARAHLNVGLLLDERNQPEEAEKELLLSLELWPEYPKANYGYGRFLAGRGRTKEALPYFRKAVELWPNYKAVFDALGNLYARQGNYGEAIPYYRQALSIDTRFQAAQRHLAIALSKEGEFAESNQHFREILGGAPNDVPSLAIFAWNLAVADDESLRDGKKALVMANRANQIVGRQSVEVLEALAVAHAELGQFGDAAEVAGEAIQLASQERRQADLDRLKFIAAQCDQEQRIRFAALAGLKGS